MVKKKKQIVKDKIDLEDPRPTKKAPKDKALDLIDKKMKQWN